MPSAPHRDEPAPAPDPSPGTAEVAYLGVADLRAAFDSGKLHSRSVTEALLSRIAAIDAPASPTALRSVLAVSERALGEAGACDRSAPRGPLHGIPVLVKDNIEVAGLPSTAGATSLAGRPARSDAPLVARLREAGAVVLGTTNLSEWANIRSARSTSGWSAVGGLTCNPWALDRNAGGSSSGSGAAVAAGLAPLAVGTETDGSITNPASFNGIAGIKPTVGAVPTAGIVPISASQDSPGPMGRTVEDVALLLEVLAGVPGIARRAGEGVRGVRIGVARTWRTGHPETDSLFDEVVPALERAGATICDVEPTVPSDAENADELTVLLCELFDGLATYLPTRGAGGPQDLAEVVAHERRNAAVELAHFGHDLFEQALRLGGRAAGAYPEARSRNLAWALEGCLLPAMADVDAIVAPTYGPAVKSDLAVGGHHGDASPITMAPAIAGWPIATAPMGLVAGLPVGFGAIGRPGSEALLLAVCRVLEQPARPAWALPRRG